MLDYMTRHWWVLTVRGALAVLFGVLAVFWPGITAVALAVLFGAYALVDGVLAGVLAFRTSGSDRTPLVVEAVLGVLIGVVALIWPLATVIVLTILIGAWAVFTGVVEIVTAVRLRKEISGEWLYILGGALSVCFGLLIWFWPLQGAVAIALIIGVYAILFGVVFIVLSLRLRSMASA
ncbi:HdeD family acid-resistance protein [Nocardiopsis suaedae]|uniref:HdeD family acid-resistance protein n=1 Tax=Nocardiopsis suaedae TaxID=3018444 RepID=A0ABT4TGW5_9ACTN|nr:HdeD family acid-resistance protein [Nocardiopsis suaedae]MDA2803509.1 HdeD family acid-resistance protein [Nocardiopsis suaedae]